MMQLWRHIGELCSAVHIVFNHIHFPATSWNLSEWTADYTDTQIQQSLVNVQLSGTFGLLSQAIRTTRVLHGQRELSRPKHDVIEGIMMLADDMSTEATLLIGLS